MPIYEYECRDCGHSFDLLHNFKDDEVKPCESCQSPDTYKVMHAPAVVFKGQGFYVNDTKMDAKEAVKKKYEKHRYQDPVTRGEIDNYSRTQTCMTSSKPKKKD